MCKDQQEAEKALSEARRCIGKGETKCVTDKPGWLCTCTTTDWPLKRCEENKNLCVVGKCSGDLDDFRCCAPNAPDNTVGTAFKPVTPLTAAERLCYFADANSVTLRMLGRANWTTIQVSDLVLISRAEVSSIKDAVGKTVVLTKSSPEQYDLLAPGLEEGERIIVSDMNIVEGLGKIDMNIETTTKVGAVELSLDFSEANLNIPDAAKVFVRGRPEPLEDCETSSAPCISVRSVFKMTLSFPETTTRLSIQGLSSKIPPNPGIKAETPVEKEAPKEGIEEGGICGDMSDFIGDAKCLKSCKDQKLIEFTAKNDRCKEGLKCCVREIKCSGDEKNPKAYYSSALPSSLSLRPRITKYPLVQAPYHDYCTKRRKLEEQKATDVCIPGVSDDPKNPKYGQCFSILHSTEFEQKYCTHLLPSCRSGIRCCPDCLAELKSRCG
jgi:hypothetical protein